ncbi:Na+/H+ antiporter subunit E [Roseinatronobacter sp.]|uniref:Na+/H+ antiporter subunit E n=1 Tax=Roseinatronobacter sp. TaxID=1945755 RepID=UPI0025D533EC|nr:Na+/H+ antiporter subunit E [Rhodobaca sp.]
MHRALLLGGAWLTLTGAEALVLGVLVTGLSVWLSLRLLPAKHPLALWRLAQHLPRFLAGSVSGGVDVARRAFSSDMRLNPGWLEISSDLPDGARVALGGELSLMPGTLSAGSEDGKLLVHVLDTSAGFDSAIPREVEDIAAIIGQTPKVRP